MHPSSLVYLNGAFMPATEAKVSVLDRGFLFADGVYEVIPVYGGHLFRLEHHLQRLDDSLAGIRLANPLSHEAWRTLLEELVRRNGDGDQSLYLQVTRGVAKRDHAFPAAVEPTVFAMSSPLLEPAEQVRREGVAAITVEDIRWKLCHIKSIALLPNVLLRQHAVEAGAAEAILVRGEQVTEAAASNVFAVLNGIIVTPPKSALLLPGITRDLVVELAREHDLPLREDILLADDLPDADEIWLTSSTREVTAVTRLDGHPVGSGKPGPMWARITELYRAYKARLRAGG
ncbi:D-amino acid aminotransferase [Ectothiorhodospiraceae bacterium 2226]|nr:D-amino acid aminotransferase [Ectothiorhodospiraceae bacterium 2226]